MKTKLWFSLIEVIVAISVLTIWVFWVYKLIWSNMLLLSNSESNITLNSLKLPLDECMKNFWYDYLSWAYALNQTFSINFWSWNLDCLTWSYDSSFSFTPVIVDNAEYYLYEKMIFKWNDFLKFETNIYSSQNWYLYNSWTSSDLKNITIYKN